MTTGEQLDNISTVSNVSALTHLMNPSGEGGGVDRLVPYDELTLNLLVDTLGIDIISPTAILEILGDPTRTIEVDITPRESILNIDIGDIEAQIESSNLEVDITKNIMEVENGNC